MDPLRPVSLRLAEPEHAITSSENGSPLDFNAAPITATGSAAGRLNLCRGPQEGTERLKRSYLDALAGSMSAAVMRLAPVIEHLLACGITRIPNVERKMLRIRLVM